MERKRRWLNAMHGVEVDRPPVTFWRHFLPEAADQREMARRHAAFFRETGLDMLKVMHDGLSAPCSLQARTAEDLLAYRPQGRSNPYIRDYVERCKRVVDAVGGEVYVYCNIFSAFCLLRRIGDSALHAIIKRRPDAVRHAMDAMTEDLMLLSEMVVSEAGCLGSFICFQGAEQNRFSDAQFDELVRPYDMALLKCANLASPYNVLHFCAWDGIRNALDRVRLYPGCAVNWAMYVEGLDLPDGHALFSDRPVMGGFDNRRGELLYSGSKDDVQAETRRIVEDYRERTGGTAGLILGADCSFLPDFDISRFTWVRDALMKP